MSISSLSQSSLRFLGTWESQIKRTEHQDALERSQLDTELASFTPLTPEDMLAHPYIPSLAGEPFTGADVLELIQEAIDERMAEHEESARRFWNILAKIASPLPIIPEYKVTTLLFNPNDAKRVERAIQDGIRLGLIDSEHILGKHHVSLTDEGKRRIEAEEA